MPTDPRFDALRARLPPRPRPGVYLGLVIRAFPVTPRVLAGLLGGAQARGGDGAGRD